MKTFNIASIGLIILVFVSLRSFATVHTVNNVVTVDADFTQITDAVAAASAGDTIQVHGSPFAYANFTINKKLHIIGPGYFLEENSIYETEPESARVAYISIDPLASYSILEGLQVSNTVTIKASNVTIRKNRLVSASSSARIVFASPIDTSYIYNNVIELPQSGGTAIGVSSVTLAFVKNIYIANNIIGGSIYLDDNTSSNSGNRFVVNNTFANFFGVARLDGVLAINNLFADEIATNVANPAIFQDNLFLSTVPSQATGNGNTSSTSGLVFFDDGVNAPLDHDMTDLLPEPNPASDNCGTSGCGATYGANPHYRLSGIPELPILYHLTADNAPSGSGLINVTVKAKAY